jgi:hypothetical protein
VPAGIHCPHCKASVALDRIGMHFQKFCTAITSPGAREASMLKFNQLYSKMQSQIRGEISIEELQSEADRIFLGR